MSSVVTHVLHCDRCGAASKWGGSSKTEAQEVALRHGWQCLAHLDRCPACRVLPWDGNKAHLERKGAWRLGDRGWA